MMNKKMLMKKAQGEIFGLALVFVILILGIIVYAQFKASNPDLAEDSFKDKRFKELATSTLPSLAHLSTGCFVQSSDDSLSSLLSYCFDFANGHDSDPIINCKDEDGFEIERDSCSYAMELFNTTLQTFFNKNSTKNIISKVPFSLTFSNENYELTLVDNVTLTNLPEYGLSLNRSNSSYYQRKKYKKSNGGLFQIETSRRAVLLDFNIYYR